MIKKEDKEVEAKEETGFEVHDPKVIAPKDLPPVVIPKGGKWANEAQVKYAITLNAYAYRNPVKWDIKREKLLSNLKKLEKNPSFLNVLIGRKPSDKGSIDFGKKNPPK